MDTKGFGAELHRTAWAEKENASQNRNFEGCIDLALLH